jgi:O-antigen ligase/Flp pilus assembly protein TadD
MNQKEKILLEQSKLSEWDEGIFVILIMIIILVPIVFFPYCIPVFAPIKDLLFQILVLLGFVMWSLKIISAGRICFRANSMDKPILLYLFMGLFSLIWTINIYNSILAIPLFIAGPILFFIITNSIKKEKTIKKLLLLIISVATCMGTYGILQYLGIDFEFWGGNLAGRRQIFGLFGNVNYFAEYMILPLSLTIGLILSKEKVFNRFFLLLILVIMSTALFLTFTRGSYLAIALSIPVILFLYYRSSSNDTNKQYYKKIILYFLLLVIIALAAIYVPHPLNKKNTPLGKLRNRVTIESLTSGSSILRRVATWKFTWMMVEDYPLLGSGLGTYNYHTLKYQAEFFAKDNNRDIYPHGRAAQAHNEYLQLWSELGIIGLLVFLWIVVSYYHYILKYLQLMKNKEKAITIGLAAGVTAVLVDAIFGFPLQLAASLSLFWMFLGLTTVQINITNIQRKGYFSQKRENNEGYITEPRKYGKQSLVGTVKRVLLSFFVVSVMVFFVLLLIRPFMARVYWYYGNQQRFSGNSNKAIHIYEKALKWNPWQGDIYIDLANSVRITRSTQDALKYLHKTKIFTDNRNLPGNIAYLYYNEGKIEKAIPYLEEAIKYQRDQESMIPLQLQLGNIYLKAKDYKKAEQHFDDVIENNPDSVEAYYGIAGAYINQDKREAAVEALQKVIELAPESKLAGYAVNMLKKIELENKE